MTTNPPPPRSPDAPPDDDIIADDLDGAFDAMFLHPPIVSPDNFDDDWGNAVTEQALALSSVNDARLKRCIDAASASVWGVPAMRPAQLEACYRLLHPYCPNSLLVIHRTGGGKTHILRTLGVIERGIVLIFIPLLTLSADVMHKFEAANTTWGNVGVYHLDELYDSNRSAFHSLLRRCSTIERNTTSTLFVFLSPQFLVHHRNTLDIFVICAGERTLRLIAMDEAHIHVQHGTSFRDDIRALRAEFFVKVYGNQPILRRPRLIALSATFPTSYVRLLSHLLTVDLTPAKCILRGCPAEFCQREIEMKLEMCGKKAIFVSKGLTMVANFLEQNPESSVVIFCNSRHQSLHIATQLEKKLDMKKLAIDVLNINGSLDKTDKFWRIRLFCDNRHSRRGQFRALVTTNASNVGIDKHSISLQVRFEWCRDLQTYFQERGRGSRSEGVQSTCILYADLASYIYLMTQLITKSQDDEVKDHGSSDVEGYNSAISPSRNERPQNRKEQNKYALGTMARRSLRLRTTSELQDVIRFFCLDRGCQHARGESYLAFGGLDLTSEVGTPCVNSCSICTRRWHEMFLPVYRSSVMLFFEYLMQSGQLPHEIDPKSPVSSLLAGSTYWKEALFDRAAGGISRMHVDSFFMSLIASGMIK